MKRYLIEEIGSASSDDEKQEVDESCQTTAPPNKSDFIETLNHLHLPNQVPVSHNTSLPVKTVGENTEYTSTIEDHNHLTKPACNDDNDLQKLSKHESSKPSQLATTTGSSCLSMTTSSTTAPNGQKCNLFPPLTSIQFQSTWKRLEKNRELQYSYLKVR